MFKSMSYPPDLYTRGPKYLYCVIIYENKINFGGIMKISARNQLRGVVTQIIPGAVNSEIVIKTSGGETIVSVITKESVESLGLKVGNEVYAVIKASNVLVAVD